MIGLPIAYPALRRKTSRGRARRARALSFDDAQILRLESAAIKGHTGKVLLVGPDAEGGALDAARLRERVAERIGSLPRLRQRVDDPARQAPTWVDADPDLEWHVAEAATAVRWITRGCASWRASCSPSASTMSGRCGG